MKKLILHITLFFVHLFTFFIFVPTAYAVNLNGEWVSKLGEKVEAKQSGDTFTLTVTDTRLPEYVGTVDLKGKIKGNTFTGQHYYIADNCPNLTGYISAWGTVSYEKIEVKATGFYFDPDNCVKLSDSEYDAIYTKTISPSPTAAVKQQLPPQPTQSNPQDNEKDKSQKSKEQPKIGLPLFATGWLRLFETFWNAAGVNASSIIENINMIAGTDHTLCDPANCEISLENLQKKTGLSEEEIINRLPSVREREINPYKLQRQNGDVYIGDYDKSKGFIMVTGKDGVIFSTFLGLEDHIGGFEVSPNTKINLPSNPFQGAKYNPNQAPKQLPTEVELEFGEAEFFIIGSAEKPTTRPTFVVATPNTEVKVFGTHFWVKHDPDKQQTTVGVYEGEVEVITKSGQKTTVVPDVDKPGVVVVTSKLSSIRLVIAGIVLAAAIGGIVLLIKRKRVSGLSKKKR